MTCAGISSASWLGKNWPLLALKNSDLTLEDLFLQLTSSDEAHAAEDGEAVPEEPALEEAGEELEEGEETPEEDAPAE